jgi:hypothetical protein
MKFKNREDIVAEALRHIAWKMCENPGEHTVEEGKMIDRALRSCRGIIDIDVVWVQWRYQADLYGWSTDDELRSNGRGYRYPINATKDNE